MSPENSRKWRSNFWNADRLRNAANPIRVRWDGSESEIEYAIATILRYYWQSRQIFGVSSIRSSGKRGNLDDGLIGVCRKNQFQLAGGRRLKQNIRGLFGFPPFINAKRIVINHEPDFTFVEAFRNEGSIRIEGFRDAGKWDAENYHRRRKERIGI